MISFTTRGSLAVQLGHVMGVQAAKRVSSPESVGPAVVPVLVGTQSAGPAGGAGSGQMPGGLSWYGVLQPLMIEFLNSAAPGPSQEIALDRLPPVRRSIVVCVASE